MISRSGGAPTAMPPRFIRPNTGYVTAITRM
jgi:hypothetical protein